MSRYLSALACVCFILGPIPRPTRAQYWNEILKTSGEMPNYYAVLTMVFGDS